MTALYRPPTDFLVASHDRAIAVWSRMRHAAVGYQRNRARRYDLLDEQEKPDEENVALMKAANEQIARWMDEQF